MIRRGATRPHPRTRRGMGAGTVGRGASRRAGSACAAPGGAIQGRPDPAIGMARFRRSWGVWRGNGGAPDRRADDDARRIAGRRGDGDDPQHGGGGRGGGRRAAGCRTDRRRRHGNIEPPGCAGRNDDAPQRAAVRVARGAHGEPDVAMQRRRRADAAKRAASAAVTGTMSGACSAPARTGAARHASGAAPPPAPPAPPRPRFPRSRRMQRPAAGAMMTS